MAEVEQTEENPSDEVRKWLGRLKRASHAEENWRERARKIIKRYRDEEERENKRFNILWSNTQVLKPALYSATPEPDVRRRYKDEDPVAREISEILERALAFTVDSYDFDGMMDRSVLDVLLPGRGTARVRYVPTFQQKEAPQVTVQADPDRKDYFFVDLGDGQTRQVQPDEIKRLADGTMVYQPDPEEEVVYEEARCEYVNWDDLRIDPARTWQEVTWVAFRHRMTRKQMKASFPKIDVSRIPMGESEKAEADEDDGGKEEGEAKRSTVWEIWDKEEKELVFIAEGYPDAPVDRRDDPLHLSGFFPIPRPLYSMETNNTLVPVPEFTLYQDQADELNQITHRIAKLIKALKARGLYAGEESDDIGRLLSGDDAELIPVRDFGALVSQYGGLDKAIAWMPIQQIAAAVNGLYQQRDQLIQTIYQITGISDIMRGSSDPRETKGAQQIKASYGSLRMKPRQKDVERFVRDLFRMKAEIMAEQFDPQTLELMTGKKVSDQVLQLLRNDGIRGFRVDIETDSTVAREDHEDKQQVTEMFSALGSLISEVVPAVEKGIFSMDAAKEMVKFGMRRFKVSRQVEDALDQMGQGQPANQGPDPVEVAKLQQQQRDSHNKHIIDLMKLKKEYAQMESDEESHLIDQAVQLAQKQDENFSRDLERIMQGAQALDQAESQEQGSERLGV